MLAALKDNEIQWIAKVLGLEATEVVEDAVRDALASGSAVQQKASLVLPLTMENKQYVVKKASSEHLDTPERRARTGRSLKAEHAFYTGALQALASSSNDGDLLVPRALGAYLKGLDSTFARSQKLGKECEIESQLLLILQDARYLAQPRLMTQVDPSPGGLSASEAETAVSWLAQFHATFWANNKGKHRELERLELWQEGGYWAYAKRVRVEPPGVNCKLSIDRTGTLVEEEWAALIGRLKDVAPELKDLRVKRGNGTPSLPFSTALAQSACAISRRLSQGTSLAHPHCTLLHGDFKAANIFLDRSSNLESTAVDYQWCGWGLGAVDLMYFLTTSLSEDSLGKVEGLIKLYHSKLTESLDDGYSMSFEAFRFQVDIAMADYGRYLVAEMWRKVDLESLRENKLASNVGMHKRSLTHLVHVVQHASQSLENLHYFGLRLNDAPWTTTPAGIKGIEMLQIEDWNSIEVVRRDIARLFSCCIALAQMAGKIVEAATESSEFSVTNKEKEEGALFDPQTLADVNSEKFLVNVLGRLFPEVTLVGEEGIQIGIALDEMAEREISEACLELEKYHMDKVASWEINLPIDIDPKRFSLRDVTVWIDPLDGTRELLRGDKEAVTTLLGISVRDRPVLGVIHQPFTAKRRTVFGGIGCDGVWEHYLGEVAGQARPLAPKRLDRGGKAKFKVVTTRSHGSQQIQDAIAKLGDIEAFGVGGAGRKVLMLLDGEMDAWVFPSKGTKRWDTCPGEALLEALGGFLVQADSGTRYEYDAVASPLNLNGVIAGIHHYQLLRNCFDWRERS